MEKTLNRRQVMTLGARIAQLRRNKGESLQKVADAVGVSKAHIWELEKNGQTTRRWIL